MSQAAIEFEDIYMDEEWRDIPNYPGYQASSLGRIRSTKLLKPTYGCKNNRGYLSIKIKGKINQVHRLVLFAFKGLPSENKVCDHINRNPIDNKIENLRWTSQQENLCNRKNWGKSNFKGVHLHVCKNKKKDGSISIGKIYAKSEIYINKSRVCLGYFKTEEEAHEAYKTAYKNHYGYEWTQ